MARTLSRVMEWFLGDRDEDDYDEDLRYEQRSFNSRPAASSYADTEPLELDPPAARTGGFFSRGRNPRETEVLEMRPTQPSTSVHYPRSFKDAQALADQFKSGTFLILDLSRVEDKDRARLVHFLCGVAYGCDGKSQRINELTFAFAPRNYALHSSSPGDFAGSSDEDRASMDLPRFTVPS